MMMSRQEDMKGPGDGYENEERKIKFKPMVTRNVLAVNEDEANACKSLMKD